MEVAAVLQQGPVEVAIVLQQGLVEVAAVLQQDLLLISQGWNCSSLIGRSQILLFIDTLRYLLGDAYS